MIPKWPAAARAAVAYLFRPLQDLDIYVEDTGDEVFYSELFARVAPKGVRILRVFSAGNRANVIARARTHDFSARRALFLIDGDFEWVRNEPPPSVVGVYRLEAYCIENLLIDEQPLVQILIEEEAITKEQASTLLAFGEWLNEVGEPLVKLFVSFAVLNSVDPTIRTVGYGLERLISSRGKGKSPALDPKKTDVLRRVMEDKTVAQIGKERHQELQDAMQQRLNQLPRPVLIVSGKDFLLPLLDFRLQSCSKARIRRRSLRVRLARHCNTMNFGPVTEAIKRAVSVTALP